ncbi:MAG: DUF6807 family protein [Planctomycetota bacterium]
MRSVVFTVPSVLSVLFVLSVASPASAAEEGFAWKPVTEDSLGLYEDGQPVLVYNHGMILKKGVPERYRRACYLHPVYGLDGEVITDDFPRDHRHHRGIFWAWPHIKVGDAKEVQTWIPRGIDNKLVKWVRKEADAKHAVLECENGWFVGDKKVVAEHLELVAHPAEGNTRALDFELTWTATDEPVRLTGAGGKSYGGFNVRYNTRFREKDGIKPKQVTITVPSGVTKKDLPDTRLKWADFIAPFPGAQGQSGAAVFIHDSHPDYPPTWLTRHYGCLCVGWPGVKGGTLQPGKPVTCRYRVLIHRGDLGLASLKKAYEAYLSREE